MAGHDLIDAYLGHLGRRMRWRADSDDIVAEVGDHLRTAVERYEATGLDPVEAQRQTLERFGDPDLVATAFATTTKGGVAMPTQFTRQAGTFALVAAALWIVAPFARLLGQQNETIGGDAGAAAHGLFIVSTVAQITAIALTAMVMLGLRERLGGLGASGAIALVFAGLAALMSTLAWFLMGWGVMLAIGTFLFGAAMSRLDVAPRAATLAFGGAWSAAIVSWVGLRAFEVGSADSAGDYWVPVWAFIVVGTALFTAGLVGLGRWLRSEEPADIAPAEPFATA